MGDDKNGFWDTEEDLLATPAHCVQRELPCYKATVEYGGYLLCPECKAPMLYDIDCVRCCGTKCSLRGVRFEKPTIELRAL